MRLVLPSYICPLCWKKEIRVVAHLCNVLVVFPFSQPYTWWLLLIERGVFSVEVVLNSLIAAFLDDSNNLL